MKHLKWAALLMAVCLFLSACTVQQGNNTPSDLNNPQPPVQNDPPAPDDGNDEVDPPPFLSDLALELVVDSETANTLLSHLDELTSHLRSAVEAVGYQPDSVTITFSTAGAYTTDSLVAGGIAVAILPTVDIIACEKRVSIIALSTEEIPETAIAVSAADEAFSEAFCNILFRAFTETEAGEAFLSLCCAGTSFTAPTEDGLQAARDYLEELEKHSGGNA